MNKWRAVTTVGCSVADGDVSYRWPGDCLVTWKRATVWRRDDWNAMSTDIFWACCWYYHWWLLILCYDGNTAVCSMAWKQKLKLNMMRDGDKLSCLGWWNQTGWADNSETVAWAGVMLSPGGDMTVRRAGSLPNRVMMMNNCSLSMGDDLQALTCGTPAKWRWRECQAWNLAINIGGSRAGGGRPGMKNDGDRWHSLLTMAGVEYETTDMKNCYSVSVLLIQIDEVLLMTKNWLMMMMIDDDAMMNGNHYCFWWLLIEVMTVLTMKSIIETVIDDSEVVETWPWNYYIVVLPIDYWYDDDDDRYWSIDDVDDNWLETWWKYWYW